MKTIKELVEGTELAQKNGKMSKDLYRFLSECKGKNGTIRIKGNKWTGSKSHMKLDDSINISTRKVLRAMGVKFETGNDSSRGGACGEYIEFKLDKRNSFLKAVANRNFGEFKDLPTYGI